MNAKTMSASKLFQPQPKPVSYITPVAPKIPFLQFGVMTFEEAKAVAIAHANAVDAAALDPKFKQCQFIIEVGIDEAKEILANKMPNRNLSKRFIDKYASDMSEGLWTLTHQGISFNDDNRLNDGQQRFEGFEKQAGKDDGMETFVTWAAFNVSDDKFPFMDNGIIRKVKDALKIAGYDNITNLAAALKIMHIAINNPSYSSWRSPHRPPSSVEILSLVDGLMPEMVEQCAIAKKIHGSCKLIPSVGGAFFTIKAIEYRQDDFKLGQLREFAEGLMTGVNLYSGDPRLVLREKSFKYESSAYDSKTWYGWLENVWKHYIKGVSLSQLSAPRKK